MKRSFIFILVAFAICFCAMTSQASAQATRTWVSGVGDDANPCSRTAPCKTFAGAISKTADCGEIDALDPGGFGTVTITKGIKIDGGGGEAGQVASILAVNVPGVTVNDSSVACTKVTLRNLDINGVVGSPSGGGTIGVNFLQGGYLSLENVDIENFSQQCLNFQPSVGAAFTAYNSNFENCQNGGIVVSAGSGTSRGNIEKSTIQRSGFPGPASGLKAGNNALVNVHNTMISQNGAGGATTGGIDTSVASANISVDLCTIANNFGFGVHSGSSSTMRISNSSIQLNTGTGMLADGGGQMLTGGNNWIGGNGGGDGARTGLMTVQ
jgi:parallel beta helix pectate lyase-like protein